MHKPSSRDKSINNAKSIILILLIALLSACTSSIGTGGLSSETDNLGYPIDIVFADFHKKTFDGILGHAISPKFYLDGLSYQYYESGMLGYDPASREDKVFIVPLGRELGIIQPAVLPPPDENDIYLNGHRVYPIFVEFFLSHGGEETIGAPLTEARYNLEYDRIEQFFENFGLYYLNGQANPSINLLAYGVYACNYECRHEVEPESIFTIGDINGTEVLPEAYIAAVLRQSTNAFGNLLSSEIEDNGLNFVIFENIVLTRKQDEYGNWRIFPLDIPLRLGIEPGPIVPNMNHPDMSFFPIEGDLGHNIPKIFVEEIFRNGGYEMSGPPITEILPLPEDPTVYQQCFTNLCMQYYSTLPEDMAIQIAPLGHKFQLLRYPHTIGDKLPATKSGTTLTITQNENIASTANPPILKVTIAVEGRTHLKGLEPKVTITYPDLSKQTLTFPPTNNKGVTLLDFPPIEAANGTHIPYEVCIATEDGDLCIPGFYISWNPR